MLQQGTRASVQSGTEIDRTSDYSSTYMEVGKVYSGTFAVTGVFSGNEQSVIDSIAEQIEYPTDHPEAHGVCTPTYILVDSSNGIAYAEWIISGTASQSYGAMLAPIAIAVIIGAILLLGIIFAWFLTITIQRATEFIAAAGSDFTWIAIAGACIAVAVVLVAGVYAYKSVVSDKPIMQNYNDYRDERRQNYEQIN